MRNKTKLLGLRAKECSKFKYILETIFLHQTPSRDRHIIFVYIVNSLVLVRGLKMIEYFRQYET